MDNSFVVVASWLIIGFLTGFVIEYFKKPPEKEDNIVLGLMILIWPMLWVVGLLNVLGWAVSKAIYTKFGPRIPEISRITKE